MVIVDTSVWVDYFLRPSSAEAEELTALLTQGQAVLVGVVLSELVKGARNESQRESLYGGLVAVPYIEMGRRAWERAGSIGRDLEAAELRIPASDAFIAALALENDYSVFTRDKHFERIPGLQLYRPEGASS